MIDRKATKRQRPDVRELDQVYLSTCMYGCRAHMIIAGMIDHLRTVSLSSKVTQVSFHLSTFF